MKAHLLTIGDELLIGQTVNTNAAWLGEQLSLLGVDIVSSATVGDDASEIMRGLDRGFEDADLVVTTGGLGPTHDDMTVATVAQYFGKPMEKNDRLAERISQYYHSTGREVPEAVQEVALVPADFEVLANDRGTAPGLWYEEAGRMIAVLPGVPKEMKGLFERAVRRKVEGRRDVASVAHRTLRTIGIVESGLQQKIGSVEQWVSEGLRLAYLPSATGVRLRLSADSNDQQRAQKKLDSFEEHLRDRIGKYIYGRGKETLEEVIGNLLAKRSLTLAVAESCTGGYVLHRLTNVSGSSAYLLGGVVAYDNNVKANQLGVSIEALLARGAVSEIVARQMAQGVRQRLGADIGLSTTGIAGPTGGSEDKPVGTLWLGYADTEKEFAVCLRFTNDRIMNKKLFSSAALDTIRRNLLEID